MPHGGDYNTPYTEANMGVMHRFCIAWALCWLLAPSLLAVHIRPYLRGGPWYPEKKEDLLALLKTCFDEAPMPAGTGRVVAVISPHAGLAHSGKYAARAFRPLHQAEGVQRVILLGPSHRHAVGGAVVGTFTHFATPLGNVPVDTAVCRELARLPTFQQNDAVMENEHSLENLLPPLQYAMGSRPFRIVPIVFGAVAAEEFATMAKALRPYLDEHTIVAASTDLTHLGAAFSYQPFRDNIPERLRALDDGLLQTILRRDRPAYVHYHGRTGITMCGFVPVGVLLALLEKEAVSAELAGYGNSAENTGDYRHCVSYGAVVFRSQAAAGSGLSAAERRTLLRLARSALQVAAGGGRSTEITPAPAELTATLRAVRGVFVTLRRGGNLRGCIGSIVAGKELYRGVQENAVQAALHDPRFPPVASSEVDGLTIEVSVLTPLQAVDHYRRIRLGRDGVVLRRAGRQAVFLPQVAGETGWSLEEFLANLCQKAGLPADSYRSPDMEFFVFQAEVFSEEPGNR